MKITLVAEDEADVKVYLLEHLQTFYYVNVFIYKNRDPFYLIRDSQGNLIDDFVLISNFINFIETKEEDSFNEKNILGLPESKKSLLWNL